MVLFAIADGLAIIGYFFEKNKELLKKTINRQQKKPSELQRLFGCTPAGGRTLDTLIKSQVLYQLSYGSIICGCKNTTFFYSTSFFLFFSFIPNT